MNYLKAILIEKHELKANFEQITIRKDTAMTVKVTVKTFGFKEHKPQVFSLIKVKEIEYVVVLENTYLWDLIKNTGNLFENSDVKEDKFFNLNDVF